MISSDQFLRRSLLTPLAVPVVLAVVSAVIRDDFLNNMVWIGSMVVFCLAPYVWMLFARRYPLFQKTGRQLEREVIALPLWMVPYFLLTSAVLILCALFVFALQDGWRLAIQAIPLWLVACGVGLMAVPVVGYLFVGAFFAAMRALQAFGWVGQTERLTSR